MNKIISIGQVYKRNLHQFNLIINVFFVLLKEGKMA